MIGDLEENLERLTLDIPDASIDDLPLRYERSLVENERLVTKRPNILVTIVFFKG